MINLFSLLAWCNIGHIDWEPWLPRVFNLVFEILIDYRFFLLDFYTNIKKLFVTGW